MKPLIALLTIALLTGCAAKARMTESQSEVFQLHNRHVIERDLTQPLEELLP